MAVEKIQSKIERITQAGIVTLMVERMRGRHSKSPTVAVLAFQVGSLTATLQKQYLMIMNLKGLPSAWCRNPSQFVLTIFDISNLDIWIEGRQDISWDIASLRRSLLFPDLSIPASIGGTDYSYVFLILFCIWMRKEMFSVKPLRAGSEEPQEKNFEINLRQCCIDCQFLPSCPVAQEKGGPETDQLLGTYRLSALTKRCLL